MQGDRADGKKERTGGAPPVLLLAAAVFFAGAALLSSVCYLRETAEFKWQKDRYETLARAARPRIEAGGQSLGGSAAGQETAAGQSAGGSLWQAGPADADESHIDFDYLLDINPDTVGWIRIPDTRIDYPIVQASDNNYYLETDFFGGAGSCGAVFLDFSCASDFSGANNIIYGHHIRRGLMFRDLEKFRDPDFFNSHPYFEICTPREMIRLRVIACCATDDDPDLRRTDFISQEDFEAWLSGILNEEPAGLGLADWPTSVFLLVTCGYETPDGRTVLFAVREGG